MNVIVIASSPSTGNIVKNALQQASVPDLTFTAMENCEKLTESKLTEDTYVLVDWEGPDPALLASHVKCVKDTAKTDVPVILLCTKKDAGSTFAGMKAGAQGVVNKPISPEELVRSLVVARKQAKAKKSQSINVEFINPFIEATKTVFKTMAQMEADRKRLFLKDDHKMLGDISGVMGLSGSASGSVVISLPTRLALELVGKMLGEDMGQEITPEVSDGVGEIINMISGQAKASLTKTKYHFQISIPTVVTGTGHEITHKQGTPNIVVLFEANAQTFAIQVCLSPSDA
jgi:chemotaxis protein CheX